jgi:cation-transporting ATPase 13A2
MLRDWRDPAWTSVAALRAGITEESHLQRQALFGDNLIKIQTKSILQLLVDECLHPFCPFLPSILCCN